MTVLMPAMFDPALSKGNGLLRNGSLPEARNTPQGSKWSDLLQSVEPFAPQNLHHEQQVAAGPVGRTRTDRNTGPIAIQRHALPCLDGPAIRQEPQPIPQAICMWPNSNKWKLETAMANKLKSGDHLPDITVPQIGGGELRLGIPVDDHDWQMVVIYRGKHCPICKAYLTELERTLPDFAAAGVGVIAVSGDPEDRARSFAEEIGVTFPVGYGLTVDQMKALGLYVSEPRSEQETDRPFPEPGVFVINADGLIQVVDISNAPFARPDLASLAKGLKFIRDNNYPIRGRLAA